MRTLQEDIDLLNKDMFVSLAIQNTKVYLVGGLIVALCGILSIAVTNFRQTKSTFGLARVRGASPADILKISTSEFSVPTLLGATIGMAVAAVAAYGLTNELLELSQQVSTKNLPVDLVVSGSSWAIWMLLVVCFSVVGLLFGLWIFRKTPREILQD